MAEDPSSGHLDEATWERLGCNELDGDARDAAIDHITACAECAGVYRAVSTLRREAAAFDPNAPAEAVPWRPGSVRRWAYGAAAVAAGLVTVLVLQPDWFRQPVPAQPVSSLRGSATAPVTLEPSGILTSGPRVFRWQTVSGAETYRMRLLSRDGVVIWSSAAVSATVIEPPASVRFQEGIYFWDVSAHSAGEPIGQSELTRFEVRR